MNADLRRTGPALALLLALGVWHSSAGAAALEALILDQNGVGLEHAVVSLHGDAPSSAPPGTRATMDQRARQFEPTVVALQAGTDVYFPNSDDVRHHVYSFSHPNAFELKLYHGEESRPVRFDEAGIVALGCNIHDGMVGFLQVVDTPFFAKSDASGETLVTGVPSGAWTLQVWHPDLGIRYVRRDIDVAENGSRIVVRLDAAAVDGATLAAARPGTPPAEDPLSEELRSLFRSD